MKGLLSDGKGQNPRCSAQIHPADATRFGIQDGQLISVTSRVGKVEIPAELTDKIMPGVISIPHGWGHNKAGSAWKLAEQHSGVSVNDLTDEMCLDELSGNTVLNGESECNHIRHTIEQRIPTQNKRQQACHSGYRSHGDRSYPSDTGVDDGVIIRRTFSAFNIDTID